MGPRGSALARVWVLALGLSAGLAMTACGSEGRGPTYGVDPAGIADLAGGAFVSTNVEGRDLVEGTSIRLAFEDGSMAARAGCNTIFGGYVNEQGELSWEGSPASTKMACEPALAAQDAWLTDLLTEGMRIVGGDADLTLESDEVRIELDRGE